MSDKSGTKKERSRTELLFINYPIGATTQSGPGRSDCFNSISVKEALSSMSHPDAKFEFLNIAPEVDTVADRTIPPQQTPAYLISRIMDEQNNCRLPGQRGNRSTVNRSYVRYQPFSRNTRIAGCLSQTNTALIVK